MNKLSPFTFGTARPTEPPLFEPGRGAQGAYRAPLVQVLPAGTVIHVDGAPAELVDDTRVACATTLAARVVR